MEYIQRRIVIWNDRKIGDKYIIAKVNIDTQNINFELETSEKDQTFYKEIAEKNLLEILVI